MHFVSQYFDIFKSGHNLKCVQINGNSEISNEFFHKILNIFLSSGRIVEDILCPVAHELIRDESS